MNSSYHHRVPVLGELGTATSSQLSGTAASVMIPLGSTEQHGPHLPLDTDTRIATAVARRARARLGDGWLVAPAIAYGASGEHQSFAGTISLGTEALTLLLVEYGRSAGTWARRLVFVNGHGGNVAALGAAVARLRAEGRDAGWCPCVAPAVTPTPGIPKHRCCCISRRPMSGPTSGAPATPHRCRSCSGRCAAGESRRSARSAFWATRPPPPPPRASASSPRWSTSVSAASPAGDPAPTGC
ncbi:creatinine amidohydrolase family protein [Mycobacterium intracellulare]|nr:creatinine amidohydrolase family protein [Mycobacterium intracellulare]